MKIYFTLILFLLNLTFSSFSYSQNPELFKTTCRCFQYQNSTIKTYSRSFIWFGVSAPDPKYFKYPYHLICVEMHNRKIKNPVYYFEYYNNFQIYNESLINCLNYSLACYSNYSGNYKTHDASNPEEFKKLYDQRVEINYKVNEQIKQKFRNLYHSCYLAGHNNPLTLYDHGFLAYTDGNAEEAMVCAEKYINLLKNENNEDLIQPQEMLLLGQSYLELNEYSKAIEILSDLIQKDPTNKEAYLNRSFAYFETGSFDEAILDFNLSEKEINLPPRKKEVSFEFSQALIVGLYDGSKETVIEFIPSLCDTAYGLGTALWIGVQAPIESSKKFARTCYDMCDCVIDYCKSVDLDTIDNYIDQMKIFYEHLDNLSDKEKGELIGYTVGKYGVDFFAGAAAIKGVKTFRNLKAMNRICNLEAMSLSITNKEAIITSSLKHAANRKAYIKNVKYNFNAHNKHILGHNDFKSTRGIWEHKDPENLLRRFAGTGHPERGSFGSPGYKETVDFKEHIGIWKNKEGTIALPTTRGTIHYGEKGAHIVPSNPDPLKGKK